MPKKMLPDETLLADLQPTVDKLAEELAAVKGHDKFAAFIDKILAHDDLWMLYCASKGSNHGALRELLHSMCLIGGKGKYKC